MLQGMLWFDDNPKTDLAKKIKDAAEYYEKKYGKKPNMCWVNPKDYHDVEVNGIEVQASKIVLPHHLWIGMSD